MKLLLDIEHATMRKLLGTEDGSDYSVKVLVTRKTWYCTETKQPVKGDWEEVQELDEETTEDEDETTDQTSGRKSVSSTSVDDL